MVARSIERFSIVKYEGKEYVIETRTKPITLIHEIDGKRLGKEINELTELEVIYYPAQLAFAYINKSLTITETT